MKMNQKNRVVRTLSQIEEEFALHCKAVKLEPIRELKFCETRRFRFDFAFPEKKLAIEIEGGLYNNGRHTRPLGYLLDCEKYNLAVLLGWRVLRFGPPHVKSGYAIDTVLDCLN